MEKRYYVNGVEMNREQYVMLYRVLADKIEQEERRYIARRIPRSGVTVVKYQGEPFVFAAVEDDGEIVTPWGKGDPTALKVLGMEVEHGQDS